MKNLRKLGTTAVLTAVFALFAFAGETPTSACTPGQIDTPPCAGAAAPGDMDTPTVPSTDPGQTETPPASGTSFTEIAADVLLNFLPLF